MLSKIFISGANGFIGSNILEFLTKYKLHVKGIGRTPLRHRYIRSNNFDFEIRTFDKLINENDKFDVFVHCASEIPAYCNEYNIYKNNMALSHHVVSLLEKIKPRLLIFLSSMSAYGEIKSKIVDESYKPINQDEYGRSKYETEKLFENKLQGFVPSIISIRLPGVIGKNSHNNFLSNVVSNIKNNKAISASNPNSLFNNVIYINDLCEFILNLINEHKLGNHIINVGCVEPLTINEILIKFHLHFNSKYNVKYVKSFKQPFLISLDKAKSVGFSPKTVLETLNNYLVD